MSDIAFAAVDWGTTTYRMWLIDSKGTAIQRCSGPAGLAKDGERDFEAEIESALAALSCPSQVPVLMCGMIGAAQGWVEATYQSVPYDSEDLANRTVRVKAARDIRILPGICQKPPMPPDVMRGEETILAGLLFSIQDEGQSIGQKQSGIKVCLPGTHSKWARINKGTLVGFQTYMTGEVFALLSEKSVLSQYTTEDTNPVLGTAFEKGVVEAFNAPEVALNLVFSCRSTPLVLGNKHAQEMRARLSGLLIGLELSGALKQDKVGQDRDIPIQLVSYGELAALYGRAFDAIAMPFSLIDAEQATRAGLLHFARSIWPDLFDAKKHT